MNIQTTVHDFKGESCTAPLPREKTVAIALGGFLHWSTSTAGKMHRVVYGLQTKEFTTKTAAAEHFANCVLHGWEL